MADPSPIINKYKFVISSMPPVISWLKPTLDSVFIRNKAKTYLVFEKKGDSTSAGQTSELHPRFYLSRITATMTPSGLIAAFRYSMAQSNYAGVQEVVEIRDQQDYEKARVGSSVV